MDSRPGGQAASEIVIRASDVVFECPACGKSMVIDVSAAGMIVLCGQCHANVIVPPKPIAPPDTTQREEANEALLLAAQQGDLVMLNKALARGADVNTATANGTTALLLAVQRGEAELIDTLIAHGANLEAKRADGQTALSLAERGGQFHIVRVLWKAGVKRPVRFFRLRRRG